MLNVTVVGNVYDESGFRLDCQYSTEYKDRDVVGPTRSTSEKQLNFNVGDPTELGCQGTMRSVEVMYLNLYTDTRSARQRILYAGESVLVNDVVLKPSYGLEVSLVVSEVDYGVYRLTSNSTAGSRYYVYVCSNSIFDPETEDYAWKLVKTIDSQETYEDVVFCKSVKAKIECEAFEGSYVSAVSSEIVDIQISTADPTVAVQPLYIDWE